MNDGDGKGKGFTADLVTEDEQVNLEAVRAKLDEAAGGQGAAVKLSRAELGLLHKMLTAPEEFRREQVFLLCDFLDEDEALDHVAAYYEALDLGMDTGFNVAFMFALAACNRKGEKTNRVSAILDSLQHVKYTANVPKHHQGGESVQRKTPLEG